MPGVRRFNPQFMSIDARFWVKIGFNFNPCAKFQIFRIWPLPPSSFRPIRTLFRNRKIPKRDFCRFFASLYTFYGTLPLDQNRSNMLSLYSLFEILDTAVMTLFKLNKTPNCREKKIQMSDTGKICYFLGISVDITLTAWVGLIMAKPVHISTRQRGYWLTFPYWGSPRSNLVSMSCAR